MVRIAHIINPVQVSRASDLYVAQPITSATMRAARAFAAGHVQVELYTTQYSEDHPMVPGDFTMTPDLERSVLDITSFSPPRKLPLIADILGHLYAASDADYLIYSNVDIALQPFFYRAVGRYIESGLDAFVINRRTISSTLNTTEQIPQMYAEVGEPHRGWDCFVFRRDLFPHMELGQVCIGAPLVGLTMIANLIALSKNFFEFRDVHLTFHLGDDQSWRSRGRSAYADHNREQSLLVLKRLEERCGPFSRQDPVGSYLLKRRLLGGLYDAWAWHSSLGVGLSRILNHVLAALTSRKPRG